MSPMPACIRQKKAPRYVKHARAMPRSACPAEIRGRDGLPSSYENPKS
jgi:hypothetical protein